MTFNIQRFSTHDGPGIRTVVFLKGCPLRCTWCENPESQVSGPELLYDERLCIGCLECLRVASRGEIAIRTVEGPNGAEGTRPEFHRDLLDNPEVFRDVCPTEALTVVGKTMTVREIVDVVLKDLAFYGEAGGVTFSGGEPFMQPTLLLSTMRELRRHAIGIAIETSLQAPWSAIEPTLALDPLLLADVKHVDERKYRAATGGNLSVAAENLRRLEGAGAHVVARVPVIPGFNNDPEEMHAILEFISSLSNVTEVDLLPYHSMGRTKYGFLGREYRMDDANGLPFEILDRVVTAAERLGLRANIGG